MSTGLRGQSSTGFGATGGSLVPEEIRRKYIEEAEEM